MKRGDKLIVIDHTEITQTYIPVGSVCEFIKTFDAYACVLFNSHEYLLNKKVLEIISEAR